jgi:hypothetical protein
VAGIWKKKAHIEFWWGKLNQKEQSEKLGVGGKIY